MSLCVEHKYAVSFERANSLHLNHQSFSSLTPPHRPPPWAPNHLSSLFLFDISFISIFGIQSRTGFLFSASTDVSVLVWDLGLHFLTSSYIPSLENCIPVRTLAICIFTLFVARLHLCSASSCQLTPFWILYCFSSLSIIFFFLYFPTFLFL